MQIDARLRIILLLRAMLVGVFADCGSDSDLPCQTDKKSKSERWVSTSIDATCVYPFAALCL